MKVMLLTFEISDKMGGVKNPASIYTRLKLE